MAENIQALIDLLSEEILKYDLSHIRGDEIVNGNPEHCINLLQLAKEISCMMQGKQETVQFDDDQRERLDREIDDDDFDQMQGANNSNKRRGGIAQQSYSDGKRDFDQFQGEDDEEALQMEDVSINLEDAVGSAEDLLPASSGNNKKRKQQQQYDYVQEGSDDQFDQDPMQLAHAEMMGQEDNVD